jgi:hypothetical protein
VRVKSIALNPSESRYRFKFRVRRPTALLKAPAQITAYVLATADALVFAGTGFQRCIREAFQ